jgi:ABC-type multidrug transport system fused ATPase/permease subunit
MVIKQTLNKYWHFLGKRTSVLFLVALVIGVFWFLSEASFIFVLQTFLVSIGLFQKQQTFMPEWLKGHSDLAVYLLILFGVFRSFVQFSRTYVAGVANQSFMRHQRSQVLEWALLGKLKYSSHELSTTFNETITHAGIFLMRATEFLISATSFIFFFFMGLALARYELIIAISILGVVVIPLKVFDKRIYNSGVGLREEYGKVNRTLLQVLRNRLFLDLSGQTRKHVEGGKENLLQYERHYKTFYKIYGLKAVLPNLVGISVISLVTILSIKYFKTEPIKLLGFFYIFIRLSQAASEASGTLSDFKLHSHAFKLLMKMAEDNKDTSLPKVSISKESPQDILNIEFDKVNFGYEKENVIIRDLSFKLAKGDKILISGPSGSGKSTITHLLTDLLTPNSGKIWINKSGSENMLIQKQISYAGPDPFLIDGTIRENLLFGSNELPSDAEIIAACQAAEIWSYIDTLPLRLDFKLDESAQISTGQKQRIAIARALLKSSQIVIFDEATSNIDFEVEHKIMVNLEKHLRDKITILISHRNTLKEFTTKEIRLGGGSE